MKLEVTKKDLKEGKRDSPTECPVSLALRRWTRPGVKVRVYQHRTDYKGKTTLTSLFNPPEVKEWLQRWDAGKKCLPQEFEWWIPRWASRVKASE